MKEYKAVCGLHGDINLVSLRWRWESKEWAEACAEHHRHRCWQTHMPSSGGFSTVVVNCHSISVVKMEG